MSINVSTQNDIVLKAYIETQVQDQKKRMKNVTSVIHVTHTVAMRRQKDVYITGIYKGKLS